jgi:hypothetical protein
MDNKHDLARDGKIKEHVVCLLSEYDLTERGFCVNFVMRSRKDIFKDIEARIPPEIKAEFDYMSLAIYDNEPVQFPETHRLAIHYVTGGSEGYYVHVASINRDDKYELIWLAKTLHEKDGPMWCRKLIEVLEDILKP